MFEMQAKDKPVLIERFDINMDAMDDSIAVYYRTGTVDYVYDDSYKLILLVDSQSGAGQGSVTSLPPFSSPVLLTPGTPLTFYVTCTTQDGANLWYDEGVGSGTTYASDDNINIIEGMASGYPWRGYALDRRWNGVVYYSVQSSTSTSPTGSPTISLSTPPPTNQPTPSPTNQPTKSPVGAVTPSPTASPVGTSIPTASPVDIATRTQSPSNVIDDVGVVGEPTPGITSKPTTTTESDSSTKSPTTSQTEMPTTGSPTVEETFFPTKTVTNLLPNFVPSSASDRFYYMARICLYSSPLFIIAFFVL